MRQRLLQSFAIHADDTPLVLLRQRRAAYAWVCLGAGKLIKIGAKVVRNARSILFQLAEVAEQRKLFAAILNRIRRLLRAGGSD